ncbi:MAG: hydrolase [Desulfomonilaceae bacterium]
MDTKTYSSYLEPPNSKPENLIRLLRTWADINTGSRNIEGLEKFQLLIKEAFQPFPATVETIPLAPQEILRPEGRQHFPQGKAVSIIKQSDASMSVLLSIHYDTVYAVDHPFQKCITTDGDNMNGPGVADAKGGLIVLLEALKLFELSPWSDRLGWEALIVPDEEIGSVGSTPLLLEAAKRNHLALVFEPALPDGSLVGSRNGSSVYSVIVRGRAAHAGRDPEKGRNAIHAMANLIVQMQEAFAPHSGITLNVGEVVGGGAVNVVPDLAYLRFNIRTRNAVDQAIVNKVIEDLTSGLNRMEGFEIEIDVDSSRPPKVLDQETTKVLNHFDDCGQDLGIQIRWRHSGGASDANIIGSVGIPTVDGLGVRGGGLHSPDEYVVLDSLSERVKLTALFLMKLASGDFNQSLNVR